MLFDLKRIEFILIEQDPEGLIKIGAPNDEYSSEAFMIYSRLSNERLNEKKPIDHIAAKVISVFVEQFGRNYSEHSEEWTKYFYKIAKLIYDSAEKE